MPSIGKPPNYPPPPLPSNADVARLPTPPPRTVGSLPQSPLTFTQTNVSPARRQIDNNRNNRLRDNENILHKKSAQTGSPSSPHRSVTDLLHKHGIFVPDWSRPLPEPPLPNNQDLQNPPQPPPRRDLMRSQDQGLRPDIPPRPS